MSPAATVPGRTIRQKAKAQKGTSGTGSRDVVKPVLANPFTVAWPSLPNHLQVAVFAALPEVLPASVSAYHVTRQRCTRAAKRRAKEKQKDGESATEVEAPPPRPELLDQLVFGLNETIKALESGIADLRLRMLVMSDALEGKPALPPAALATGLLPTAPAPASEAADAPAETPAAPLAPLAYVLVPNGSVSPPSLIDPLPVYCATYNTLLKQHAQLAAEVRKRLPKPERFIERDGPEIRLVPLGQREAELSALVGLRRVSTFAIRNDHPAIGTLERLLPNSVLPPPRHTITLPFPTSSLAVVDAPAAQQDKLPAPQVQYPALHVKAVHTTAPIDTGARKNQRLIEVRMKRVENKEKRREARVALERAAAADLKAGAGKKGGRAARLAAKAAEATPMDTSA